MICDRCKKSGSILKDVWAPDGWKLSICAECRKLIDAGAGFTAPKATAPRLTRMAKQLRREDDGVAVDPSSEAAAELLHRREVAAIQPFPASWRKNK